MLCVVTQRDTVERHSTKGNTMTTEIGDRIAQLRSARDLSLRQLAEISDISFNQIHKYEKGVSVPNRASVIKLAKVFNVKPTWLLFGRDVDSTESDDISNKVGQLGEESKATFLNLLNRFIEIESVAEGRSGGEE